MKGSVNEDYFLIVHNALQLMRAKTKITWMQKNKFLHIWLDGLQDGTPYSGWPVGNSTNLIPLYGIHNRDILHSFSFH